MAKYPLFRGNFVLWYAILDSASVRCSELRGGLFSEVCFVLKHAKINLCFSECPLEGGYPLASGRVHLEKLHCKPKQYFIVKFIF